MKSLVESAIEEYNRFHGRESVAKLVEQKKDCVVVEFSGSYCRTCGVNEYFEDLRINLEDRKIITRIQRIKETENGHIVEFNFI